MAIPLRLEFPNALYHITSQGDRREDIYEDQIYLGNDEFVSEMQGKIEKGQNDWSIPKKQKRATENSIQEINNQSVERNTAIITAYATGVYSQRELVSILIYIQVQWGQS